MPLPCPPLPIHRPSTSSGPTGLEEGEESHEGRPPARAGRRRTGASEPPQVAIAMAVTPDAASSHQFACAPGLDETSKP